MIDREHDLPITKQADVLRISRGSVYYTQDRQAYWRPSELLGQSESEHTINGWLIRPYRRRERDLKGPAYVSGGSLAA